jgi:hypothetical protein
VRVDNVSCTERVYNDDRASASVRATAPYVSDQWGGSVELGAPVGGSKSDRKLEQRCKETLKIAERTARLQERKHQLEIKIKEVELKGKQLEIKQREKLASQEARDIKEDW